MKDKISSGILGKGSLDAGSPGLPFHKESVEVLRSQCNIKIHLKCLCFVQVQTLAHVSVSSLVPFTFLWARKFQKQEILGPD